MLLLNGKWLALLALGRAVTAELSDAPSTENYVRRSAAKATVLGNYVYVDGGEISQLDGGVIRARTSNPVNSTLSIDISQSWSSSSVKIRTIPKTGPTKINVHLWTDTAAGTFFSWGGKWFTGINMTKTELWKFKADGQGGGAWSVEPPANPSLFDGLIPGEYSAVANTADMGYLVGGIASGWTELYRAKNQVLPGMLTFNMKTRLWQNGTIGFSPVGTLIGAEAAYVPAYGPNGLVVLFGGYSPVVDAEPDITVSPISEFQNLTFFDPQSKKVYWQATTGDIPPSPRARFCVTGFRSSGAGYDIFMSGGMNQRDKFAYNDAYVLSLPGFVWTKLPDPPGGPRAEQSCVAVGNRQVLSIGGTNPYSKQWTDPDPAPQGLLIFDMTAMQWKDSYDANAAAYESPEVIKGWYSNGSLNSVKWASEDVKRLFAVENETPPNPDPNGQQTNDNTSQSSTPVGAIAGGVVGGVVALALIVFGIWFFNRRRHQQQQQMTTMNTAPPPHDGTGRDRPEYPYTPQTQSTYPHSPSPMSPPEAKYTYTGPQEIDSSTNHHELGGGGGKFGGGGQQHHELSGDGRGNGFPPAELDGGNFPRK